MHIEVKMPDIGLDEVEVIDILVKVNEEIKLEQGLIVVEGDKTSMEIPSPISGIVKKIYVKVGDKVATSRVIMVCIANNGNLNKEKKTVLKKENIANNKINQKIQKSNFIHATPVVRRLARHLDINLINVVGSGPKNRILKEDVELYKKNISQNSNILNTYSHAANNAIKLQVNNVPITDLQKKIGNNLYQNWINIPHVTQFDEVNITDLEDFRTKYNCQKQKNNSKDSNITILIFIIKAISYALSEFPIFNSSLSSDKKHIVYKKYINIGIAIDVNGCLFVPVLQDVNKKNITQLSLELSSIIQKTRENKLIKSDTINSCFTISNLGGIGGSWFSPIINAPEVAILGVSKATIKPLWNGKTFVPSLMLPISLSYDHRVINGADGARFITFIRKLLSNIRLLIM